MSRLTKTMLLVIGCFVLTSCSQPKEKAREIPDGLGSSTANNVPAIYKPLFDRDNVETIRSQLPFESISIRRTQCYVRCPAYEMVLHRDGRAELNAQANMPKLGKFIGGVDLYTFGRLCYLIESSHFSEMDSSYSRNWTDQATCIVAVKNGSTVKEVSDYGKVGPIQLWAIQELLDSVKDQIEWRPPVN